MTLTELRRRKKIGAWIAGVLTLALFLWALFAFSFWMANKDKEDFAETCAALQSEPYFGNDWLCIRDGEVVYG